MAVKSANLTFKSAAAALQSMLEILGCPATGESNYGDLRNAKMNADNKELVLAFNAMCDKLNDMVLTMRNTGITEISSSNGDENKNK